MFYQMQPHKTTTVENRMPMGEKCLRTRSRLLAAAISTCFVTGVQGANLPTGGVVAAGNASFNQIGNVLNVTNSNGTVINWNTFSIGSGYTTNFIQSSVSSSVLNRVLSADPSVILGTLTSNGRVFLINPNGIMVGAGSRIDVAGFIASTLNISDANFLANKLQFDATPGAGSVINNGSITTPSGGSVYLVAPNVSNNGIITTPQGETILAAGQTVTLLDTGTPGVSVEITGAEGNATNLGAIVANAGKIGIAGVLVKNSGTLNASSATTVGGRVFLKASQDAYVDGSGRIVTTGTKGGSVEVLGNRVAVIDNASIDASGTNGGGSVLIGGDFQGKNAAVQNATVTYFGANASIKADATGNGNGNGGKVIVWSDDTTRAYGSISAKGGANGGNGGFVETSGHRYLDARGARVNAGSTSGLSGTWLIDPSDITIAHSGGGGYVYGGGVFNVGGATGSIYDADINATLGSTNLVIETSGAGAGYGGIATTAGVNIQSTSAYGLSLLAYGGTSAIGNIDITTGTVINIDGNLTMVAGWDGASTSAPASVAGKGNITITDSSIESGSMTLQAGHNITQTAGGTLTATFGGYSSSIEADGNLFLDGTVTLGGGSDLYASSGYSGASGKTLRVANIAALYGGSSIYLGSSGDAEIGVINAPNGYVSISGQGAILDPNGTALNITADVIDLYSQYGGAPGTLAITLDTAATTSIYASVGYAADNGGISIRNVGAQPSQSVAFSDGSVYGGDIFFSTSTGDIHTGAGAGYGGSLSFGSYGGRYDITVSALAGDLYIDNFYGVYGGGIYANTPNSGTNTLLLDSVTGNVYQYSSASFNGDVSVHAAQGFFGYASLNTSNGNLDIHAASVDLGYAYLSGNHVGITTGSLNMSDTAIFAFASPSAGVGNYGVDIVSSGAVNMGYSYVLGYTASVIAGGKVSLDSSDILGAYGVAIGATGVSLDNGSTILGGGYGGYGVSAGNVEMVISGGDLIMNNGSSIVAGNDVILTLTGANAQVVLNESANMYGGPSTILSDVVTLVPATTIINFLGRSSGGVVIDGEQTTTTLVGGSGCFTVDYSTACLLGSSLEINYGSTSNIATQTIDDFFSKLTDTGPTGVVITDEDEKKKQQSAENTEGKEENGQTHSNVGQCT